MENLLKQSMEYVQKNIHAKTDELPMELLAHWVVEDIEHENQDQWTIFMTAYMTRKSLNKKNHEFKIETEELMRIFNDWQILLSAVLATQMSDMKLKPLPAFDFENIKNYEFEWSPK